LFLAQTGGGQLISTPRTTGRAFHLSWAWPHLRNFLRHLFSGPENVRPHDERAFAKVHFWITFAGAYCILHAHAFHRMRVAYAATRMLPANYAAALPTRSRFMTYAAFITGAAQLIFLFNFFWSLKPRRGPQAKILGTPLTLEWITTRRRPSIISAAIIPVCIAARMNSAFQDIDRISSAESERRSKAALFEIASKSMQE